MSASSVKYRPWEPGDKNELRAFFAQHIFPHSAFLSSQGKYEMTLRHFETSFESILTESDCCAVLAVEYGNILGIVVIKTGRKESITQEKQSEILELISDGQETFRELLILAAKEARKAGDAYLVYHTLESQALEKSWAKEFGFQTELVTTYIKIPAGESFESHPDYRLRKAEEHEILFILGVITDHSPAYIPAHRVIDKEEIQASFLDSYSELSSQDKKRVPLVLERISSGALLGYIILQPNRLLGKTGPLTMYLYDIAIGPKGYGLGLSRWIELGAKQLMSKMGGGFLYGDVSPANKIAMSANLSWGTQIDSRRWGLKL